MARRTHAQIVADIRAFDQPINDGWVVDWDELEKLQHELWEFGRPADAIPDLFAVFERFSTADGHSLWGLMHGLESLPGYAAHLGRSVVENPSVFGVRMLGRILNGGAREIEGHLIYSILQSIADQPDLPARIRDEATGFMSRHSHLDPMTE